METDTLITCNHCGAVNRVEARFCQKCGMEFQPTGSQQISSQTAAIPTSRTPPPPSNAPSPQPKGNLLDDIVDELVSMGTDVRDMFSSLTKSLRGPGRQKKSTRTTTQSGKAAPAGQLTSPLPSGQQIHGITSPPASQAGRMTVPTQFASNLINPKGIGEVIGGYAILETRPLKHSNYYHVRMERCSQGHTNPGAKVERCATCQAELNVFLMRETDIPLADPSSAPNNQLNQTRPIEKQYLTELMPLSRSGTPGFLKIAAVFEITNRRYVVSDYPSQGWQSLTQVSLPVTEHALLAHWVITLGQALLKVAESGFNPETPTLVDVLESIIVTQQQVAFADLSIFTQRTPTPPMAPTQPLPGSGSPVASVNPSVTFLAQVLYSLASGKHQNRHRAPRDYSDVPPPFRGIIARVDQNAYPKLESFLNALRETQRGLDSGPGQSRSLRQIAGYGTDTGKKRDHNEDFVGKYSLGMQQTADAPEVGLYLVADGMGGHQAGELASREVVRVILNEIQENVQKLQAAPKLKRSTIKIDQVVSASDVLKQAVQRANDILFNARQKIGSDRGTTLTAALVIGDLAAIANVGDSRTYLWRDSNLKQITRDHSLVASLVAANMIRPDEVRSHPQRNQILRTLGEKAVVEVDVFECPLRQGDRLILCSDGLWEMTLDPEINQILTTATNPQEACDRLIDAANLAGGEDNISVVSVWMA